MAPILRRAPRSHLSLRKIEYTCAIAALRHLQQRAPAGLLRIVAMRRNGQNVEWLHVRGKNTDIMERKATVGINPSGTLGALCVLCG
jgi:hypothetical protein